MATHLVKPNFDKLGIVTSIACAIHCTVLPLLVAVLPMLDIPGLEHPALEWSFIVLALLFGTLSMMHGYRRHHGRLLPFSLFSVGFVLLLLNQLSDEAYVYALIPASAGFIISGHVLNMIYSRRQSHGK
ncbi:MerC domain-containing protein [Parapedobacter luteus]|nr:MerC domain-containing protein [Parapedobacter luteus]